jgi:hypothetical protein
MGMMLYGSDSASANAGGSWHRGDLKNDGVGRLLGMGTDSTEEREKIKQLKNMTK